MNRDMLTHILQTDHYIVDVDPQKNRLYTTVQGAVTETSASSRLLEELHELKHYLSSGFTMLVDVRQEEIHRQEHTGLIRDVMDLLFEGGISRIAEIRSELPILQLPQKWSSGHRGAGIQQKIFKSREEAEAWLDAL